MARLPLRVRLAVAAAAALAGPLGAGTGTIEDGRLDLLVYFAYDETDPASWEPVFAEYSRLLANATEGQLQLGTVAFTTCEFQKSLADVWVLDDFSGARSHLNGLGVAGRHMTISQTHKSTGGFALGQFGLVHETGHYVWGVYDEYLGFVGGTQTFDPLHYCSSEFGTVACFMDGGTTIPPNNQRTEFCTQASLGFPGSLHFEGATNGDGQAVRTFQEYYLGVSCWERIEASGRGSLVAPVAPPSVLDPPVDPPTFDYDRLAGTLGLALVLDKSGSMSSEGKLDLMKESAAVAIGLMRTGELLTVVAFDDAPQVLLSATAVNDGVKAAAIAAVNALEAGGGTAIGSAIQRAVTQLGAVSGCKEFLVVLTDGVSEAPLPDDPAVLAALAGGDHQAFGVALGSFADEAPLIAMSSATGGQFYASPEVDELPATFARIFSQASGATDLEQASREGLGGSSTAERAFEVGALATSLRVHLAHPPGASLGLELVTPASDVIAFTSPPPGAETFESDVQKTITLPGPEQGAWVARIHEPLGQPTRYDFLAFVDTLDLSVTTRTEAELVAWPEPMRLAVHVVAGVAVGGADVTATVRRPLGPDVQIRFHDDGLAVHGDEKPDDGVYGALFARYTTAGPYAFEVLVDNVDGVAASNQECGAYGAPGGGEEGQTGGPIPSFRVCTSRTVVLSGLAAPPAPGAARLAPHEGLAPPAALEVAAAAPTPIAGFALEVDAAEPLLLEELRLDVVRPGLEPELLDGAALHLDADGDGRVDRPSVPLGFGVLAADGASLAFEPAPDALAFLPAGRTARFLVTVGEALAPSGAGAGGGGDGGAGGTLGRAGGRPAVPPPGARGPLVAWAALLAALALVLGRARRRLALATALVLAAAAPACTVGTGAAARQVGLRLAPDGVRARGAASDVPVLLDGSALEFRVELR